MSGGGGVWFTGGMDPWVGCGGVGMDGVATGGSSGPATCVFWDWGLYGVPQWGMAGWVALQPSRRQPTGSAPGWSSGRQNGGAGRGWAGQPGIGSAGRWSHSYGPGIWA